MNLWLEFAIVSLAGGFFLLDRRALGQAGFSHPLVLCTIGGAVAGNIVTGVWIGVVLQLLGARSAPGRHDWPAGGAAAACGMILLSRSEETQILSSYTAGILLAAAIMSLAVKHLDLKFLQRGAGGLNIAQAASSGELDRTFAFSVLIHWFQGTLYTAAGGLLAQATAHSIRFLGLNSLQAGQWINVLLPCAAGTAALVGALGSKRHILWAAAGMVAGFLLI